MFFDHFLRVPVFFLSFYIEILNTNYKVSNIMMKVMVEKKLCDVDCQNEKDWTVMIKAISV